MIEKITLLYNDKKDSAREIAGRIEGIFAAMKDVVADLSEQMNVLQSNLNNALQQILSRLDAVEQIAAKHTTELENLPQMVENGSNEAGMSDIDAELMQIKAEIYRMKEDQKRFQDRIDEAGEGGSSPWWRRSS